jgi:trimeric autotransporter adhesin
MPRNNTKRWLPMTLILLCGINPITPMFANTALKGQIDGQGLSGFNSCAANRSFEGTMFAVTVNNTLLNFNPGAPGVINSSRFINGLASGENVVGIDFRPADGRLYALTSASRLYTINPASGFAAPVGASFAPALSGQSFGVDFNPVPDRLRVVSDADQNLRLNPNNGAVAAVDTTLAFAATDPNAMKDPNVVGAAYTNNFAGSTTTTLYSIDSSIDALVTQGSVGGSPISPNTGQLFTVGGLGVNTTDLVGLDIAPVTNAAFASLTPEGASASQLYTINLGTGAATLVGAIGAGRLIRDIAFVVRAENVFAVTAGNTLVSFNPGVPGIINSSTFISGLASGENIVGIDFRPATGQLFAVSSASRVYTINTDNGVATPAGAPFTPALNGQSFGVDFNPVPDRIRVVSDADQNLRLNPNNGAVAAVDTTLAFATGDLNNGQNPNVVGAAYTNNFIGSTTTTLYGIDHNLNALVRQGSIGGTPISPNGGQLFTVGALGVDPNQVVGLDISSESGAALASFNTQGGAPTQLYAINLTTGAATLIGAIGGGDIILDIAIEVRPPNVFAVTASDTLISFNAGTPGVINSARAISGMGGGETVVGIDFRPATGQLYALSSASRLYIINPITANAALVASAPFTPALSGANFGVDFNPVPDRIRVVSDADQNLRLNPNNGAVAGVDTTLAFAMGDANTGQNPNVVGAAYTNSFLGATTTTLYGIDSGLGALVTQGSVGGAPTSPNSGQLFTVGSLGVTTSGLVGFDIASPSNAAFAALSAPGATQSQFSIINLASGAATAIGPIGVNEQVHAIAIGGAARAAGFDVCLQDDRNGDSLQFDSCTGDYQFTRCGAGGFTLIGRGDITRADNLLTLRDSKVFATLDIAPIASRNTGSAVIKPSPLGPTFRINDSDTTNNTCNCR